ncbi:1-deoxy-D-xylulose-5-phosphate reductoisomerase [Megamonas hypermegale]|uniref:1-deoxy-D-xylulose 5-phosphate reductoisomerase n=1 Tax=Megamonas hypermegale TaxID=158847 RepID=A0A921HMS0_9FIRM|nr:1-deoxy-D-xylulose-5-phosphate reductoisomerase [Megamonas hypermegale]HJF85327.1 1-deoxy-D-xylulose-5-phosphate reductoisomerase [Megamonas hypermegale]
MKKIAVLGSTGSIGTQTLDVVRNHSDILKIEVLAANNNDELLEKQIEEFAPSIAVLNDKNAYEKLKARYSGKTQLLCGEEGLIEGVVNDKIDTVVTSLMGFAGLRPTMAAIDAGKNIALANKETLVVAGELVMQKAKEKNIEIMPIDSEHGALFQCLHGEDMAKVDKLLVTASGGPFRGKTKEELQNVSVKQCLNHPTWKMGRKITIDSATLMNKGLEVIEAKQLYGVSYDNIQVVVHPQSIVHSMVQYADGSVIAQLASTDMRLPIQYALTYPERMECVAPKLDFWQMQPLTFEKPDTDTFRGLALAYEAGKIGGSMPCVMNAANEIAVEAFLNEQIRFLDIYDIIEDEMLSHITLVSPKLEDLFEIDAITRQNVKEKLSKRC